MVWSDGRRRAAGVMRPRPPSSSNAPPRAPSQRAVLAPVAASSPGAVGDRGGARRGRLRRGRGSTPGPGGRLGGRLRSGLRRGGRRGRRTRYGRSGAGAPAGGAGFRRVGRRRRRGGGRGGRDDDRHRAGQALVGNDVEGQRRLGLTGLRVVGQLDPVADRRRVAHAGRGDGQRVARRRGRRWPGRRSAWPAGRGRRQWVRSPTMPPAVFAVGRVADEVVDLAVAVGCRPATTRRC